jgi:hypothetical protein
MKDVGRRWIAEIVFSSIKRVLGRSIFDDDVELIDKRNHVILKKYKERKER